MNQKWKAYGWGRQPTVVNTSLPQRTTLEHFPHKKHDKDVDRSTMGQEGFEKHRDPTDRV
eukprot:1649624-Amphidinium_carterae.2